MNPYMQKFPAPDFCHKTVQNTTIPKPNIKEWGWFCKSVPDSPRWFEMWVKEYLKLFLRLAVEPTSKLGAHLVEKLKDCG